LGAVVTQHGGGAGVEGHDPVPRFTLGPFLFGFVADGGGLVGDGQVAAAGGGVEGGVGVEQAAGFAAA
jgi:hypothetical protein